MQGWLRKLSFNPNAWRYFLTVGGTMIHHDATSRYFQCQVKDWPLHLSQNPCNFFSNTHLKLGVCLPTNDVTWGQRLKNTRHIGGIFICRVCVQQEVSLFLIDQPNVIEHRKVAHMKPTSAQVPIHPPGFIC